MLRDPVAGCCCSAGCVLSLVLASGGGWVSEWRHDNERVDLVEQVIGLSRKLRVYEGAVRDDLTGLDRDCVTHLLARVAELEQIVERQNTRLAAVARNPRRTA